MLPPHAAAAALADRLLLTVRLIPARSAPGRLPLSPPITATTAAATRRLLHRHSTLRYCRFIFGIVFVITGLAPRPLHRFTHACSFRLIAGSVRAGRCSFSGSSACSPAIAGSHMRVNAAQPGQSCCSLAQILGRFSGCHCVARLPRFSAHHHFAALLLIACRLPPAALAMPLAVASRWRPGIGLRSQRRQACRAAASRCAGRPCARQRRWRLAPAGSGTRRFCSRPGRSPGRLSGGRGRRSGPPPSPPDFAGPSRRWHIFRQPAASRAIIGQPPLAGQPSGGPPDAGRQRFERLLRHASVAIGHCLCAIVCSRRVCRATRLIACSSSSRLSRLHPGASIRQFTGGG